MAKEYFKSLNLPFEDYDVTSDMQHQQEMMEKVKGQFVGVPVIDINGTIVLGFDRPKIDELIKDDLEQLKKAA